MSRARAVEGVMSVADVDKRKHAPSGFESLAAVKKRLDAGDMTAGEYRLYKLRSQFNDKVISKAECGALRREALGIGAAIGVAVASFLAMAEGIGRPRR